MRKVVSIGLFILLLCHALGYVLAAVSSWWQAETTLMERMSVYRTTDSLMEFQIPLINQSADVQAITRTASDGFAYQSHFYDVVSLEIRSDTLYIATIDLKRHTFWQADLLSFLNDHIAAPVDAQKKGNQLLKLLLQEYCPAPRDAFRFLVSLHAQSCPLVRGVVSLLSRSLPVCSPPPETALSFSLYK